MSEFADKVRSLGVLSGGRTRDRVRDIRRDGKVIGKSTTDQNNGTTDTYDNRQDVTIRPPHLRFELGATVREER